jgi:hypothetical protein
MKSIFALMLLSVACASVVSQTAGQSTVEHNLHETRSVVEASPGFHDASVETMVNEGETAWLVAHLGDDPDRANPRDSDAVRRLAQRGPEGVMAVAEVFRVGDTRRMPFAKRVIERVLARRCRGEPWRVGWMISRIERGSTGASYDADAGVVWGEDARWGSEAVERLRGWARNGAVCEGSDAGVVSDVLMPQG